MKSELRNKVVREELMEDVLQGIRDENRVNGQKVICPKCNKKHVIPFGWINDTDLYAKCEECK